jgi:hypothetical protein
LAEQHPVVGHHVAPELRLRPADGDEPEQVVADLASSGEALATDAWVVVDRGRVVGLAWFTVEDPGPELPVLWFDVYAAPDLPADAGVEPALVEAMLTRAGDWLAEAGARQAFLESGCVRGDDRTDGALRAAGFEAERTFWRMERALDPATAPEPAR